MARALIIDEDRSVYVAVEKLLNQNNWVVVHASNAQLGIKSIEDSDSKFDVVLVDIFMPGMNGLATVKELRQRIPAVPIVVTSEYKFRESTELVPDYLGMAIKFGASYCLPKPFGPQHLMKAINACLHDAFLGDFSNSSQLPQ
jgi:two-component system response regulator (stage 0 sporulation protein F)